MYLQNVLVVCLNQSFYNKSDLNLPIIDIQVNLKHYLSNLSFETFHPNFTD